MKELLTIGITAHGNKVADRVIDFIAGQPVKVIISEDLEDRSSNPPDWFKRLTASGVDAKYIFSTKQGIANNRQNILDHVETKFLYTIDNDDAMEGDWAKVNEYLASTKADAIYIRCYEDGRYMHIPANFIYMCTWMQIFRTQWLRDLGGYVQSWNFIHEESATNLNLRANLQGRPFAKEILPREYLSYLYHANDACKVTFDVEKVCQFVKGIPENPKIVNKQKFLLLFKNFAKKYIPVYRINGDSTVNISNYKNGTVEDILRTIDETKAVLKKQGAK